MADDPGVESTLGIIVRLTRLTETSLIVHWITGDHGLLKTVARGARKPGNAFYGKLDLFFSGEISLLPAKRGDLHILKEVAIRDWREGLRKNYTTTLLASYCCQLMESALEPEHPDAEMHDLLRRALDHLESAGASRKAFLHFEKELARLLGVIPRQGSAEAALRDSLGTLPSIRADLEERLPLV
ncbi:MAG: DNA repair protein RecO [Luteolibacter sp.]